MPGFTARTAASPMPSRSTTPGRKLSITTSARAASRRNASRPGGVLQVEQHALHAAVAAVRVERRHDLHARLLRRRADLHDASRRSRPASATCARPGRRSRGRAPSHPASSACVPTRSEVLREAEPAAGDDVLLDLRRAAADRVDHGVAVRRLGPALHRRGLRCARAAGVPGPPMSIDALASRRENSVANSLYSDDSIGRRRRVRAPSRPSSTPRPRAGRARAPPRRRWRAGRSRWRTTGSSRSGSPSRIVGAHVVDQQVEALLDRREREHREALEVERLRDVLEAVVHLADDVLVGHEHVFDEDLVGALVAHRPDALDGDAGLVERARA